MCKKDWRLLQAYKATGLTPEQVVKVAKFIAAKKRIYCSVSGLLEEDVLFDFTADGTLHLYSKNATVIFEKVGDSETRT